MATQKELEEVCDMAKALYDRLEELKGASSEESEDLTFGDEDEEYPSSTQKRSSQF